METDAYHKTGSFSSSDMVVSEGSMVRDQLKRVVEGCLSEEMFA